MQRIPQVLVNVNVARKVPIDELPSVQSLIDDVDQKLGDTGRVLVRYSGTESKARVMIEGSDESGIQTYADETATLLVSELQA